MLLWCWGWMSVLEGCWRLRVTSKQVNAQREVAARVEASNISNGDCVAQSGECHRKGSKWLGLQEVMRREAKRTSQLC